MGIVNGHVLLTTAKKWMEHAGVKEGFQIGLTRDGIVIHNRSMQIRSIQGKCLSLLSLVN